MTSDTASSSPSPADDTMRRASETIVASDAASPGSPRAVSPLATAGDGLPTAAKVGAWLLRFAVLGHALAMFAKVFKTWQTQFGNYLFLELFDTRVGQQFFGGFRLEDPYFAALWVENLTVSLYLLFALAVVFGPFYSRWLLYPLLAAGAAGLWYVAAATPLLNWFPLEPAFELLGVAWPIPLIAGLVGLMALVWWPVSVLLLLMFGYALAEALSGWLFGGYRFSEHTMFAQMLRWGAPLVLLMLLMLPRLELLNRVRVTLATDMLRVLIAGVFIIHGYQAWLANPGFIDLILGTFGRTVDPLLVWAGLVDEGGARVSEATAVLMMKVIAIVDFLVALAVVTLPTLVFVPQRVWSAPSARGLVRRLVVPALLLWLAFWGFITALSRMTALGYPTGLEQYPELLVRTSHFLAPLALWGLFRATYWPATAPGPRPEADAPAETEAEAAFEPEPPAPVADPAAAPQH